MKRNIIISVAALIVLCILLYLELGRSKAPGWGEDCRARTDEFLSLMSNEKHSELFEEFGKHTSWAESEFQDMLLKALQKYSSLVSYTYKSAYRSNNAFFVTYDLVFEKGEYSAVFTMPKSDVDNEPDCSRIFHFGISGFAGENGFDFRIMK